MEGIQWREEQAYALRHYLKGCDARYDGDKKLLRNLSHRYDTRASSHYAFGLLLRDQTGDVERASDLIRSIIRLQLDAPEEIYHGTFRRTDMDLDPPKGSYPWQQVDTPGFAFYLEETLTRIGAELEKAMGQGNGVQEQFRNAVNRVLPRVWDSYDPNWREFIACSFAAILALFEEKLSPELVAQMDEAMEKTVGASIARRLSDAIPMNTNIELMHMFIVDFFGSRFKNGAWTQHALKEISKFRAHFDEFESFAEFNSATYYAVDLTALGLWRAFGTSPAMQEVGTHVLQGLWENIALFYNPNLENLSGPYTRAYEMEMLHHSSLGAHMYLALGAGYEHMIDHGDDEELDPLLIYASGGLPSHVRPKLVEHRGPRQVTKQFRELCERNKPGENTPLCTATAWIDESYMMGGISGSENTSGQLHPATIHWRGDDGEVYSVRLGRRVVGGHWSKHMRGIRYSAKADQDGLHIDVHFTVEQPIELLFEFRGSGLDAAGLTPSLWKLPGIVLAVEAEAPEPTIVTREGYVELVYLYVPGGADRMRFRIRQVG
ncbi:hypothetical protein ASG89_14865 [Paenibacillus sp. Soil766]|uniref:hypothetical protein n=1 Tax=Paenibacillus sp. Soil766 TaxID=1736404 RepID=UPI000708B7FD|nr:hypothetical protein [Paenibacillus sp. Soil766]KRE82531.1 hypothetical protein ASG89_14865 [Paenibacillus sp. Soil766]